MPACPGRRLLQITAGTLALLAALGVAHAQDEGGEAPAAAPAPADTARPVDTSIDQPQPYFLRISQTFAHDDNLFRVPEIIPLTSDWISSTALIAGFDQPFGRQRGYGNATLRANAYRDQSQLNNFGYDIGGGLDWSTAERLSGELRANLSQSLAQFSEYGSAPRESIGKNEELSQYFAASVRYGLTADWAVAASLSYLNLSYTADAFNGREREDFTYGGSLNYHPSAVWNFGLGARRTDGRYPRAIKLNGEFVADDYTRDSIDLTARLNATGLSTFSARLSYTREEHELNTSRDFNGWTGQLNWNYQVTGKLNLGLGLVRDTGTNTTTNNAAGVQTFLTDARLTNRVALDARWNATSKIRVNAGIDYWRETYDDLFTQIILGNEVVSASGESTNNYRYVLSANYQPTRTVDLQCGARYEKRDGLNSELRTLFGFNSTVYFCSATLALRG